jgi:hypothetical protein
MVDRATFVAAHRELGEASDAVRHLLVVEDLTQLRIDEARGRLARAYEQVTLVDEEGLAEALSAPA